MVREKKTPNSPVPKVKGDKGIVRAARKLKTAAARTPVSCLNPNPNVGAGCRKSPLTSKSEADCHDATTSKYSVDEEAEMEWQPSESDVINALHEVRKDFSHTMDISIDSYFQQSSTSNAVLHVVIDTNIFLSHLPIVKNLVEGKQTYSKVHIYVPWMVLQELDYMKTNRDNKMKLELLARKAANFIFEQTTRKNPLFRIQSLDEFKNCINLLPDENADDKILLWCLQLQKETAANAVKIILLSNDLLFCTKASACGVHAIQSEPFMLQLPKLLDNSTSSSSRAMLSAETKPSSSSNIPDSDVATTSSLRSITAKEVVIDDSTFLYQLEEAVIGPLSQQFLEYEMKEVYDEMWEQIVLVKPPWSLLDILRCVEKHWIAVFSYVYPKDLKTKTDLLNSMLKQAKRNRKTVQAQLSPSQRQTLVDTTVIILQTIQRTRKQFHGVIQKAVDGVRDLIVTQHLSDADVLVVFTRLWERFHFICGTIADATGVPHSLQYEVGSSIPDQSQALEGLRMVLPLMTEVEIAMTKLLDAIQTDDSTALESASIRLSDCLLSCMRQLSIPFSSSISPALLSRALATFVFCQQQRKSMTNGLEQLRGYVRILECVKL